VDTNVNKLLRQEFMMSAIPWIMWWNPLTPFLHTARDQKLEV